MDRFPIAQTVVFAFLAAAGIALSVLAPDLAGRTGAPSAIAVGAALFGGSLGFFLAEMFAWERSRTGSRAGRG
jgi:hypothetical protein